MISSDLLHGVERFALIGASTRNFYMTMALRNLTTYGYQGEVYPVHRGGEDVCGYRTYRSLNDLPAAPDLALIGTAPDRVPQALAELGERGCRRVVLLSDGYAERGDEIGRTRQRELYDLCEANKIELVGPNGIGVADFTTGLVAICEPIPADVRPGRISVLSHSGALLSGILQSLVAEGVGVKSVISVGNGAVLGLLDWLEWMIEDPATDTVAAYVESIGDLRRFRDLAERARAVGTSLVLLKVGRSDLGRDIALSHTASVAGDHAILEAVAADTGAVLAPDIETLATVCHLLQRGFAPSAGDTAGPLVVTSSGGAATLVADLAGEAGFVLPELSDRSAQALADEIGPSGFAGNPMDLTASSGLTVDTARVLYRQLLDDPEVSGLIYTVTVSLPDDEDYRVKHRGMLEALATSSSAGPKNALAVPVAHQAPTPWLAGLLERSPGLGYVSDLRRMIESLALLQKRHRWAAPELDREAFARTPDSSTAQPWVSEPDAKRLLSDRGLPVVDGWFVESPQDVEAANLPANRPLVVKGVVRGIDHKARYGLVELNVVGCDQVVEACRRIEAAAQRHRLGDDHVGFLVERMVSGFEVMVSAQWRENLSVLTMALGGSLVESLAVSASALAPPHQNSWTSLADRSGLSAAISALPGDGAAHLRQLVETFGTEFANGAFGHYTTVEMNPVIIDLAGEPRIVDVLLG